MTDTQILTLVIGITFPVLAFVASIVAMIYNNKRMDDFKSDITRHIDSGFEHMALMLKVHEAEHHRKP